MITVCKGCQDREVGCHAKCERYIRQRKESEEEKIHIMTQKYKENAIRQYHKEAMKRVKRNKH